MSAQLSRFGTYNAVLPKEGPKTYPFTLDFRQKAEQVVDMTGEITAGHISFISGFFCDNRKNANDLTVTVAGVNQVLIVRAGKQAYLPALVGDNPILTIDTVVDAALLVPFFVCNFPVWPCVF